MADASLQIVALGYGGFSEVNAYNPRFRPEQQKLRVTVLVAPPDGDSLLGPERLYSKMAALFPSLARHQCGPDNSPNSNASDFPLRCLNSNMDISHLMEHLIIDLLCSVGKMNMCSGVTCAHDKSLRRFDIFVECQDPRLGQFAALYTACLLDDTILHGTPGELWSPRLLAAGALYPSTLREATPGKLRRQFGWSLELSRQIIEDLKELAFFHDDRGDA